MKIKVALHGMDDRSEKRMLTIFSMNFKNQCEYSDDIETADTVIIDMDDKNVIELWTKFRAKYPGKPAIILAKEPVKLQGSIHLAKPARLNELLEVIQKTSKKDPLQGTSISSKSMNSAATALQNRLERNIKHKDHASNNFELYYDPEKFLQGRLQKAFRESVRLKKSIFIKYLNDQWIIIFPGSRYLLHNVSNQKIKTLGLVKLEEGLSYSEHEFSTNEIEHITRTDTNKVRAIAVEEFLWNITVKTSHGRLIKGISIDDPYVMERWPNLTRLGYIPNAARISAFWVAHPQSINSIIEKLNIPLEDVLTYFSAATATGLMKRANRKEDELESPEIRKVGEKKQGIFASLFNKISKNISRKANEEEYV